MSEQDSQSAKQYIDNLKKFRDKLTIKQGEMDNILALEKALKRLPSPEEAAATLVEVQQKLSAYVASEKGRLKTSFDSTVTKHVAAAKTMGAPLRIIDQHHCRIGPLMMEANPDIFSVRFLFNEEPLSEWTAVETTEDICKLEAMSKARLEEGALPEDEFAVSLYEAFNELSSRTRSDNQMIRIREVYYEIIISRLRRDMAKSPAKAFRSKIMNYPYHSFLYNLDLFKIKANALPQDKQLIINTGSQTETEKTGVTLNGLDPEQPYRKYCYLCKR